MSQVPSSLEAEFVPSVAGSVDVHARAVETRWLLWFGVVASGALLAIFFGFPYLPMVDLPQHAAQIAVWVHLGEKSFPGVENFEVNLRTPYLTGYVVARVLAIWLGVVSGLKLGIWLSVVGHFVVFALLVRKLGHSAWLALLGLPLAFGYGFYFGFVSFIAAVPFAILALLFALRHREENSWRTGFALSLALCLTLFSHGFACGVALAMAAPLLLRGEGRFATRVLPLLAPVLFAWVWIAPGSSAQRIGSTIWSPRFFELVQLPALLFSASAADTFAAVCGVVCLLLLALGLGRPRRAPEFWLPALGVLAGFCLFPESMGGFGPLHPRFAAFLGPALLVAFEPRRAPLFKGLPSVAMALLSAWCAVFAWRVSVFNQETAGVRSFVQQMPVGLSVRPIIFERDSLVFPGLPAFLHMSAYYMAEKGGIQGYSFAMYPTSAIRYLPGFVPGMWGGAEWNPERFSAVRDVPRFDCFLVHSTRDRTGELFGEHLGDVELVLHQGSWWAYRVRPLAHASRRLKLGMNYD